MSTDLFDTVMLRDGTTETTRLASSARRSAQRLGVEPDALVRLRWWVQDDAYRAVALGRPTGDASLASICSVMADLLGLGVAAADLMHQIEVDLDIEHLSANRPLLEILAAAAVRGIRVVAVSDTYYSSDDLVRMLSAVVGPHPIATVYSSADLGTTKHAGGIFDAVAAMESVPTQAVLHVGDNYAADVERAQESGWSAVHVPRSGIGTARLATRARALPARWRRSR